MQGTDLGGIQLKLELRGEEEKRERSRSKSRSRSSSRSRSPTKETGVLPQSLLGQPEHAAPSPQPKGPLLLDPMDLDSFISPPVDPEEIKQPEEVKKEGEIEQESPEKPDIEPKEIELQEAEQEETQNPQSEPQGEDTKISEAEELKEAPEAKEEVQGPFQSTDGTNWTIVKKHKNPEETMVQCGACNSSIKKKSVENHIKTQKHQSSRSK